MLSALILSSDLSVLNPCSQAAAAYGLFVHAVNPGDAGLQSIGMTCDIALIDTRSAWSETQAVLTTLGTRGIPVLFLSPNPDNARHLQNLYFAPCKVCPLKAQMEDILPLIDNLLNPEAELIQIGDLTMDTIRHTVTRGDTELALTAQEFRLLKVLLQSPDEILSRQELLRDAWDFGSPGVTRVVDITVQRLRRKLGEGYIKTVPRKGYKLEKK